ncbi:MAG TPA: hypothetical protein VMV32_08535 [Ignavibacteriaceae bacterium]|nr:hypothetical protein [Ignavibacteriaceae bacterium]
MKITLNSIILLLVLAATVFAGAYVYNFSVSNQGDNIQIEWSTGQESNLKDFVIQRKTIQSPNYTDIATIQPKGNNSEYSYIDRAAYKTNDVFYLYRLKIEDNDGSTSYLEQSISHSISAVKRTWGSIKAMFR